MLNTGLAIFIVLVFSAGYLIGTRGARWER